VAWRSASNPADAIRWSVLSVPCATLVPMLYIEWSVRRGRLSDRHLSRRDQRQGPVLVGLLSVLGALALLVGAFVGAASTSAAYVLVR